MSRGWSPSLPPKPYSEVAMSLYKWTLLTTFSNHCHTCWRMDGSPGTRPSFRKKMTKAAFLTGWRREVHSTSHRTSSEYTLFSSNVYSWYGGGNTKWNHDARNRLRVRDRSLFWAVRSVQIRGWGFSGDVHAWYGGSHAKWNHDTRDWLRPGKGLDIIYGRGVSVKNSREKFQAMFTHDMVEATQNEITMQGIDSG